MAKHHCVCGNNENHVEHGERVQSVWSRLQERGLLEKCERVCARKAPLEMLRTVHAATYVTFFAVSPTACLEVSFFFHAILKSQKLASFVDNLGKLWQTRLGSKQLLLRFKSIDGCNSINFHTQ